MFPPSIVAFTLAGISGIQISVFASRLKSWDFYKCGHKNLTNYHDQHRAANRNTSCDYLGISAIICIAADVWTLEQLILVFSIPSFQASVSKQGHCLKWGMRSSVTRIIPLGDQQDISACLNKCKNISVGPFTLAKTKIQKTWVFCCTVYTARKTP